MSVWLPLKADTSINTDATSPSLPSKWKESRDAITILMDIAVNRFNIVPKRTYIVSSGLNRNWINMKKWLFHRSYALKNLDTAILISYIKPEQESELSFTGIVPQKQIANNQLDRGQREHQGGFFSKERKFIIRFIGH